MNKPLKICAIVVTYNRKALLLECFQALQQQTHAVTQIVLIDNASTDGTRDVIANLPCHTIYLPQNQGGAGGFYEGIRYASQHSFDWLWIMDDDAAPTPECLEKLLSTPHLNHYGFLAPRILHHPTGHEESYHHKVHIDPIRIREVHKTPEMDSIDLEANAFVGVLLQTAAIPIIGLPDPSYFIWFDDIDYTYRISQHFKPGRLIADAHILHKDKVFQKDHHNWKHLFGLRNRIRFYKKISPPLGIFVLTLKTLKHILYFYLKKDVYSAHILLKELLWGNQILLPPQSSKNI